MPDARTLPYEVSPMKRSRACAGEEGTGGGRPEADNIYFVKTRAV